MSPGLVIPRFEQFGRVRHGGAVNEQGADEHQPGQDGQLQPVDLPVRFVERGGDHFNLQVPRDALWPERVRPAFHFSKSSMPP